jgi:hypothetical protein
MTLAVGGGLVEWTEQWKQEGLPKGLQVGRQRGLQEGRQEGEAAVLLRLLTVKYGSLEPGLRDRIRKADTEQLLAWSERFVTAMSLAEIFEEPPADGLVHPDPRGGAECEPPSA